jgi:4-alpha-glucanotransferase
MRVLQFAFGNDPEAPSYRPHNYPRRTIVYTGTHDNDTTRGWFNDRGSISTTRSPEEVVKERASVLRYVGTSGREIHWDMIRLALMSVANVAMFPVQDLLGLGTAARMNLPGTAEGNWEWRMQEGSLTDAIVSRLVELTATYDRSRS